MNPRNNLNLLDGDLLRAAWEELQNMKQDTIESLALELAQAAGESDWRGPGIQRDIDSASNGWIRWSSVVGWPRELAERIDRFITEQRSHRGK